MQDQLHAAAFVEKPLGDHGVLRGDHPERALSGAHIFGGLFGAPLVETAIGFEHRDCITRIRGLFAKLRDFERQLARAARRLAQPERNGGSRAVGVLHPNTARFDPPDLPRGVPSRKISPAMLSTAKSSSNKPMIVPPRSALPC